MKLGYKHLWRQDNAADLPLASTMHGSLSAFSAAARTKSGIQNKLRGNAKASEIYNSWPIRYSTLGYQKVAQRLHDKNTVATSWQPAFTLLSQNTPNMFNQSSNTETATTDKEKTDEMEKHRLIYTTAWRIYIHHSCSKLIPMTMLSTDTLKKRLACMYLSWVLINRRKAKEKEKEMQKISRRPCHTIMKAEVRYPL